MPRVSCVPTGRRPSPSRRPTADSSAPAQSSRAGQDIGLADITDGTSNTIAVVESKDAVPWTKPDDLPFDQQAKPSLYGAGSSHPGGFNCGFADGSVRFIKRSINLQASRP